MNCAECLRPDGLHWPACAKTPVVLPKAPPPRGARDLAEWWLNESMDEDAIGHVRWDVASAALAQLLDSVRAEEREACAAIADGQAAEDQARSEEWAGAPHVYGYQASTLIAKHIRARSSRDGDPR